MNLLCQVFLFSNFYKNIRPLFYSPLCCTHSTLDPCDYLRFKWSSKSKLSLPLFQYNFSLQSEAFGVTLKGHWSRSMSANSRHFTKTVQRCWVTRTLWDSPWIFQMGRYKRTWPQFIWGRAKIWHLCWMEKIC